MLHIGKICRVQLAATLVSVIRTGIGFTQLRQFGVNIGIRLADGLLHLINHIIQVNGRLRVLGHITTSRITASDGRCYCLKYSRQAPRRLSLCDKPPHQ